MDIEARLREIEALGASLEVVDSLRRFAHGQFDGHMVMSGPSGPLKEKILEFMKLIQPGLRTIRREDLIGTHAVSLKQ